MISLKEINPDAEAEAPILWPPDAKGWLTGKDPDAGKDWGQEEKGGDRGWDGWMASSTQCTRVWADSGRWWRTGKPGALLSVESQRVGHGLTTDQQQKVMIRNLEFRALQTQVCSQLCCLLVAWSFLCVLIRVAQDGFGRWTGVKPA